ncbi:MAG: hypothetical protein UV73_C0011G0034 [Candidatus Gottesmanbacteria bacterium GW2011_GWA2_43_14]|uniref:Uncharacterized protein n=1 Tax=Candidatus Gottesmanbacteria bacterium GW2011_GWA2_43_14 TaxID=1618443 RepID=A0A0G1DFI3_9BACT|nr:MAG: hypothetical protein UV73_C0011G0034 [Candidatus Gottesmanbacteria bacterium GW2011_GWA2_43_14]
MSDNYFKEIKEEASDFFEDFWEHVRKGKPQKIFKKRIAINNGIRTSVRPAYLFAERIDNLLKLLFGASIVLSAFTSSFLGFPTLSKFLEVLIFTLYGRIIMFTIGISYLTIALWKLMHITDQR